MYNDDIYNKTNGFMLVKLFYGRNTYCLRWKICSLFVIVIVILGLHSRRNYCPETAMSIIKIVFLTICVIGCSSCSKSQQITPLFHCTRLLDNPYGVVSHMNSIYRDYPLLEPELKILSDAMISNVRVGYGIDYSLSNVENNPVYQRWDTMAIKMRDYQISCIPIIYIGTQNKHPWDFPDNYLTNILYLQKRFNRTPCYYEVMNEVNYVAKKGYIAIDSLAKLYTNCLSDTYLRLKKENSNAVILSSGLAGTADRFIEKLSANHAYEYFDVLNIHAYHKPEALPAMYKYIHKVMKEGEWQKPVWLTECGMSTYINRSLIKKKNINKIKQENEKEQARRLPRIFLISFAYGVDKVMWYQLRSREESDYDMQENYGILHSDLSPKPSFYAYKTLTGMCPSGSTRPTLCIDDNLYYSTWAKPDGQKVLAIWSTSCQRNVEIKTKGLYYIVDYMGKKLRKSKKIHTSESLIYLVGENEFMIER